MSNHPGPIQPLNLDGPTLIPGRTFRRTPGVHFSDIGIQGTNGLDLVEHSGRSVSPPDKLGRKQWYVHKYQTDHNRVLRGHRLFELYYQHWTTPHWFLMLDAESGALRIPRGCLHRSYSGVDGSLLINQAVRSSKYDENTEFVPVYSWRQKWCTNPTGYYNTTPHEVREFIEHGKVLR